MKKVKQSASLVYRGGGRKLVVKKSVDEQIIDKYMAVYGESKREAVNRWREFNMKIELSKVGRGLL